MTGHTHIAFLDENRNIVHERTEPLDNETLEVWLADYERLVDLEEKRNANPPTGKLALFKTNGEIIHVFEEAEYSVAQVYEKLRFVEPNRITADQAIATLFLKLNEQGLFSSKDGLKIKPILFQFMEDFKKDLELKKSALYRVNKWLDEKRAVAKERNKVFWLKWLKSLAEWGLKRIRK